MYAHWCLLISSNTSSCKSPLFHYFDSIFLRKSYQLPDWCVSVINLNKFNFAFIYFPHIVCFCHGILMDFSVPQCGLQKLYYTAYPNDGGDRLKRTENDDRNLSRNVTLRFAQLRRASIRCVGISRK